MNARVALALRRRRASPVGPDELARTLGLPRRQVDQALADLPGAGFALEEHPMLGVRLTGVPDSLAAEELACDLAVKRVGRRIRCVGRTDSTNDLAWQAVGDGRDAADGLAIFTEHQTRGRGRRGTRWLAPPHTSILCSVVVWWPAGGAEAALLTRAAAVAIAEAVQEHTGLDAGIKWPNDLVVDDRKVGGILVEVRSGAGAECSAVIGIGVNCSQEADAFPPAIRPRATSLAMLGASVDRTLLARSLLERLDGWLGGTQPEAVRQAAAARCRTIGREVVLVEGEAAYAGTVTDLDEKYGLVLRLSDGSLRRFGAQTAHVVGPEALEGA